MHATTHTHTHCKQSKQGNYTTPHARRQDNYTTPHAAPLSSRGSSLQGWSGVRRGRVSLFDFSSASCSACSVARSTLAPASRMQHPHLCDSREVLRCSGGVARKDSCTACERAALTPCRRTHSAVDIRMAEQVSARCKLCTPAPSTPPASMRACRLEDDRSPPLRRAQRRRRAQRAYHAML
jgi:hypothetical protein